LLILTVHYVLFFKKNEFVIQVQSRLSPENHKFYSAQGPEGRSQRTRMADFVQNSQTKTAVRELASPIASVTAFNLIVQSVITDNPFACVSYMTAGTNHAPVEKTRESYTARITYEDGNANNVGNCSHRFNTLAGFSAGITALLAAAAVTTAHTGTAVHDPSDDAFSATSGATMPTANSTC